MSTKGKKRKLFNVKDTKGLKEIRPKLPLGLIDCRNQIYLNISILLMFIVVSLLLYRYDDSGKTFCISLIVILYLIYSVYSSIADAIVMEEVQYYTIKMSFDSGFMSLDDIKKLSIVRKAYLLDSVKESDNDVSNVEGIKDTCDAMSLVIKFKYWII